MAVVGVLEIQMAADLARLSNDMKRAQTTVAGTVRMINNVLNTIGAGISFAVIGTMIKDVTALNQRYQELGISMGVVGRNVGVQKSVMESTAVSIQKMGISMIESRQAVIKLAAAHIDLSNAEKLADLARNAAIRGGKNTSDALNNIIEGVQRGEVELLKGIGINVSFEQSYKELADSMGTTSNKLTPLEKQFARLNATLKDGESTFGLYDATMNNAGKQFRSTDRLVENLKVRIGGLFDLSARSLIIAYTASLKDLDGGISTITESGKMERWGDGIARTLAFIGDGLRSTVSLFNILGISINSALAQADALTRLDFSSIADIQKRSGADIQAEIDGMSKFRDALESQIVQRDLLSDSVTGYSATLLKLQEDEEKAAKASKEAANTAAQEAKRRVDFIAGLKDEIQKIGLDTFEVRKLEAAKLGLLKTAGPLIDSLKQETKAFNEHQEALSKIKSITESVATDQEKYAQRVAELDGLLKQGLGLETYNRALAQAQKELIGVSTTAKTTFNEMDQYAIGAARNIQSAFANFLFDPFEGGLKGMLKSFGNILRRMVAEMAASKLLSGASSFFTGGSSSGSSLSSFFGGGSGSGGGFNVFSTSNLLSAGSTIYQGFAGGFAASAGSLFSGAGAVAGSGTLSAFGAGLGGDALGGLIAGTEAGLSGTAAASAASSGASVGASGAFGAIPIVGLAILANTIANGLLENDKKIGGMSSDKIDNITRLGLPNLLKGILPSFFDSIIANPMAKLVTALFGRGPYKLKETNLIGSATSEGFQGSVSSKVKSQGGALVSDRTKRIIIDTDTLELVAGSTVKFPDLTDSLKSMTELLNFTLDGAISLINDNVSKTSALLGLGSTAGFSTDINIASKKGEFFSADQITAELQRVEEEFIRHVLPSIDILQKAGETVVQTFQRVGAEFDVLASVVATQGKSLSDARDAVRGISAQDRSAFIEKSGGIEALASQTQFIFDNVITDAERLRIKTDQLSEELAAVGVTSIVTAEQLRKAWTSGGLSEELQLAALNLAPLILEVDRLGSSADKVATSLSSVDLLGNANSAFATLQKSVDTERNRLTVDYNNTIQKVNVSISALSALSSALKSTVEAINPVGLTQARRTIQQAIAEASSGNVVSLDSVRSSLTALSQNDTSSFGSRVDFLRSQAQNVSLLHELSRLTDDQLTIEEQHLKALESGFTAEMTRLDLIISGAQTQLDALNKIDSSVLSIAAALAGFNAAAGAANISNISSGIVASTGIASTSNSRTGLRDLQAAGATPLQLYNAAKSSGLSIDQSASVLGFSSNDVNQFLSDTKLPRFEVGTNYVPQDMPAFLHKGEEVKPRAYVESDRASAEETNKLLKQVIDLLSDSGRHSKKTADLLTQVTRDGESLVTVAA